MWSSQQPWNLDSLLDTLLCAVGVLLIVLAASHLQFLAQRAALATDKIPENVEELVEITKIDLEDSVGLREAEQRLLATTAREEESIQSLQGELNRLQREVATNVVKRTRLGRLAERQDDLRDEVASLEIEIQDLRGVIDRLQRDVSEKQTATTLSLPVRRTIDRDLEAVRFVVRYGRVYRWSIPSLRRVFETEVKKVTDTFNSGMSRTQRINRLIAHFNTTNPGDDAFSLRLKPAILNGALAGLHIITQPRKTSGETGAQALASGSQFMQAIRGLDTNREYVRFYVWSDSFDIYLNIRRRTEQTHAVAQGEATRVGLWWLPYAMDQELSEFWDILDRIPDSDGEEGARGGTTIDN